MKQIQVGDRIIRYDKKRTTAAYSVIKKGWADECNCSSCRNFAAQRHNVYPESFKLLLQQLGVDSEQEAGVYECGTDGDSITYGGWFYCSGEVIQAGKRLTQYYFAAVKRLPRPNAEFGKVLWPSRSRQSHPGSSEDLGAIHSLSSGKGGNDDAEFPKSKLETRNRFH